MENILEEPAVAYKTFCTEEEYLDMEWENGIRYEYWDGTLVAMSGGRPRHAAINGNIFFAFKSKIKGSGCMVYNSDVLLKLPFGKNYFLPDVLVTCHTEDKESERFLHNPSIIVEVLSDSTELYDRTKKWEQYRRIKSLRYFLLVSQKEYLVDMYHRPNETSLFNFQSFRGLDEIIPFEDMGISIKMNEIYDEIMLEAQKQ
jgi:Uma2 family endonuclease